MPVTVVGWLVNFIWLPVQMVKWKKEPMTGTTLFIGLIIHSRTGRKMNTRNGLPKKGQDWFDLQGEEINPYVHHGPPAEYSQTLGVPKKPSTLLRPNRESLGFLVLTVLIRIILLIHPKEYLEKFNFDDYASYPVAFTPGGGCKNHFSKT